MIEFFFRESIAALIHSGQRADHPVYLSDLGAALTSAEGAEQQAVMEEMNVCIDWIEEKKNNFLFYFSSRFQID